MKSKFFIEKHTDIFGNEWIRGEYSRSPDTSGLSNNLGENKIIIKGKQKNNK